MGFGRPRLQRLVRRAAVAVLAVAVLATAASVGVNQATAGSARRPDDLLLVRSGPFTTRYRTWGTSGPPVVLVPGAFETADAYDALGTVLGADHRVFAVDLIGTGWSDPVAPFSAGHMAEQVLAFLDAEGLTGADAPILVGHSSGAAVVGLAGAARPGEVRGVVFLDGDALPLAGPPAVARTLFPDPYRTTALRLGVRAGWLIQRIYQAQCGPSCPPLSPQDLQRWQAPLQQQGFEALLDHQLRHGIPAMTGTELDRLHDAPTAKLVIVGVGDPAISAAAARAAAERIGAPPVVTVPGRHLTMISSPTDIAAALATAFPTR